MKNLNLGKQLTREQLKQINGAGFNYFQTFEACMIHGSTYCGVTYTCINGKQSN
ncbi:MAG TPA: hypothetical protein PL108_08805 [Sediminibacterium sp.]|nr:hypothetical protein [Sediminibacterium sp.]